MAYTGAVEPYTPSQARRQEKEMEPGPPVAAFLPIVLGGSHKFTGSATGSINPKTAGEALSNSEFSRVKGSTRG